MRAACPAAALGASALLPHPRGSIKDGGGFIALTLLGPTLLCFLGTNVWIPKTVSAATVKVECGWDLVLSDYAPSCSGVSITSALSYSERFQKDQSNSATSQTSTTLTHSLYTTFSCYSSLFSWSYYNHSQWTLCKIQGNQQRLKCEACHPESLAPLTLS